MEADITKWQTLLADEISKGMDADKEYMHLLALAILATRNAPDMVVRSLDYCIDTNNPEVAGKCCRLLAGLPVAGSGG